MLPGADGAGVAQQHRLAGGEGGQHVGHQPGGGPVAAADDVAGAGGGQRDALAGQEGVAVGGATSSVQPLLAE
jgi:hypothetical protein